MPRRATGARRGLSALDEILVTSAPLASVVGSPFADHHPLRRRRRRSRRRLRTTAAGQVAISFPFRAPAQPTSPRLARAPPSRYLRTRSPYYGTARPTQLRFFSDRERSAHSRRMPHRGRRSPLQSAGAPSSGPREGDRSLIAGQRRCPPGSPITGPAAAPPWGRTPAPDRGGRFGEARPSLSAARVGRAHGGHRHGVGQSAGTALVCSDGLVGVQAHRARWRAALPLLLAGSAGEDSGSDDLPRLLELLEQLLPLAGLDRIVPQ